VAKRIVTDAMRSKISKMRDVHRRPLGGVMLVPAMLSIVDYESVAGPSQDALLAGMAADALLHPPRAQGQPPIAAVPAPKAAQPAGQTVTTPAQGQRPRTTTTR
jgi:hypothetical protein